MSNKKILRASEIGMYSYCAQSYLLRKKGIMAQQTLQDLRTAKILPAQTIRQLQEKHHLPPSTSVDKIVGKDLIPRHLEQKIIKQNKMLQGTEKHKDIGRQTQQGAGVQEHRSGYWIVLLLTLITMLFLIFIFIRGGI